METTFWCSDRDWVWYVHCKRPADALAANQMLGKPAASDFTVVSLLVPNEARVTVASAAFAVEEFKDQSNDVKCAKMDLVSTPLEMLMHDCWGVGIILACSMSGNTTELPLDLCNYL